MVDQTKGQDAAGSLELNGRSYAWVIDGAAPMRAESADDVADLAGSLGSRLREAAYRSAQHPLDGDLLRHVIFEAVRELDIPADATATLALAAGDGRSLHIALLGDSTAWLPGAKAPIMAADFEGVEAGILALIDARLAVGVPQREAYESVRELLTSRRATRNTEGGSGFVIGAVPGAATAEQRARVIADHAHLWSGEWNRVADDVLLATDGAARILEWKLDNANAILASADVTGRVRRRLSELRTQETADRDRAVHTRFSVHDDAAFARIRARTA